MTARSAKMKILPYIDKILNYIRSIGAKKRKCVSRRIVLILIFFSSVTGFLFYTWRRHQCDFPFAPHALTYRRKERFTRNQMTNMSVLSKHIFLHVPLPKPTVNKTFNILMWKEGDYLNKRWLVNNKNSFSTECSVRNCEIKYDWNNSQSVLAADAIVFHLHTMPGPYDIPKWRTPEQRWIFFTEESPFHVFTGSSIGYDRETKEYNGVFNWSMHYRTDADVPVPYGRVVPLTEEVNVNITELIGGKTKLIAVMSSNCQLVDNNRWRYVKLLQEYVQVDAYGKCGTLQCETSEGVGCHNLYKYKFYLSFENGNCREYITEKVWLNAIDKYAVPIVMGASKSDYERLLPPNSFLHVDDFRSPRDLANYILYLDKNMNEYKKYFSWRKYYQPIQEHGYFGMPSSHYCRICEALNYNDRSPKIYNSLETYWNYEEQCSYKLWYQIALNC